MTQRALFAAVLVLAACQCTSKYRPETLSKDAAAIFSRADVPGAGGSLVVDFEEMRALGLIKPSDGKTGAAFADLAMYLLPGIATEMKNDPAGPLVARAAVLVGILRDWAEWPHAERFGLLVPPPLPGEGMDALLEGTTVVLAVKGSARENQDFLNGLAAADRAGGTPLLKSDAGDLCFSNPALPGNVCVRGGDGFFAISTAAGLKTLMPGAGSPPPPASAPAHLRLRLDVPLLGKGELAVTGLTSVKVAAALQTAQPEMAEQIEKVVNEYLARLDQNRAETKVVMAPALQQTQTALAADPNAPPKMKTVAAKMTLDNLLDPGGSYLALRQSMHVARKDANVTLDFTIPETTIKRVTEDSSIFTSVAVAGVLAAVAIPSFMKYECKSKQAEAKANLGGLLAAEKAYAAEHDGVHATTFDELAWHPGEATSYTYCLPGGCLACTKPGCFQIVSDDNPCTAKFQAMQEDNDTSLFICAMGNPDSSGDMEDLDVWFIDESGEAQSFVNDCE